MTPEQQRAIAIARARRRRQQMAPGPNGHRNVPDYAPPGVEGYDPITGEVTRQIGPASSAVHGAADVLTLGFGDEIAGVPAYGIDQLPGGKGRSYGQVVDEIRENQRLAQEQNPGSYLGGQIAGGVAGGLGLAKSGMSLAANAVNRGANLFKAGAASTAEGAVLGSIHGFGSGEGVEDRLYSGGVGGVAGGALGLAAPFALAGAGAVAKPIVAPIAARLRPQSYANAALGQGIERAQTTPNAVMQALSDARADGQGVYTVADALGLTGQRMMSTVSRTPNEARQSVVEALEARQGGQGRRIAASIAEAFDVPDTAAQRTTQMTGLRDQAANLNYATARRDAGPVNVTPVIEEIDKVLTPGVHGMARPNNSIANDSIEGAMARVRSMLTDGKSNLSEFNALFRAKLDLDDMIQRADAQGAGNRAHYLGTIQRKLDQALADASPTYARARDQFAADSRAIDAIGTGTTAANRGRAEDTVQAFRGMNVDEQYGFRGGYADPLIAQAQTAAPGVNKARPLLNDATQAEFPEFAMPGAGAKLLRQIGREDQMFQTRAAATGGSRTADNLADAADMATFDPGIMNGILSGSISRTAMAAVARALNEGKGMPPTVMSRVAQALMETDPQAARTLLDEAQTKSTTAAGRRATTLAVINALNSAGAGRLPAP